MQRQDLERMTREQLIAQAERLGIQRPRVLTQPELVDEIIGRTSKNDRERTKARGWLGRARDLLARVVERGLHLPEAARLLRRDGDDKGWPAPLPPLPTVTLAEIYAAQGHFERAIAVLDEVIAREPDHREAKTMRARFSEQAHRARSRTGREKDPPPPKQETAVKEEETEPPCADTLPKATTTPSALPASPVPRAVVIEAAPASKEEEPTVVKVAQAGDVDADPAPPEAAPAAIEGKPAASAPGVEIPVAPAVEPEPVAFAKEAPVAFAKEPEPLANEPATPAGDAGSAPLHAPLDEPPLPDRYEVDEIVAIAVDPRTIYLYWEVRATTLAHVRAEHLDGFLCVRVATVIASWEGPIVDTRDLHVDALYGDRFLRDIQPGSNVRVSVGWRSPDGFEPFAVGSEVTAPRAVPVEPVAQEVARWEPEPVEEARFQSRRIESVSMAPPPYAARLASTPTPEVAAAAAAAFVERARVVSDRGGPVDTGVAVWGPPPADTTLPPPQHAETIFADGTMPPYEAMTPYEEELDEEATTSDAWEDSPTPGEASPGWFESGGSSELGRGGSSELGRGGQGRRLRPGRGRRLVPSVPGRPSPAAVPGWPAGAPAPLLAPAAPRGAPGAAAVLGGASELSPGGASELSF